MRARSAFVRSSDAPELMELFLVSGVISVLAIRAFLALTGYPQIGGDGLHIAHMLWGGLFMAGALLLLFSALGRVSRRLSAILGGVGFGTFIDELGKFITSDNDYFYQPTIGLIYIIFIAIFLTLQAFRNRRLRPDDALTNALNALTLAAGRPLAPETRHETLELLRQSDHSDPLVRNLTEFVESAEPEQAYDMGFYFRARDYAIHMYSRAVLHRWFRPALIAFFGIATFLQILWVSSFTVLNIIGTDDPQLKFDFLNVSQVASVSVSTAFALMGMWRLRISRISAYRWFLRGVLVGIFATQVFTFLEDELTAIWGFGLNILIYVALKVMIEREQAIMPVE